ncbi:MAG: hypothetical protein V3T94_01215, partial [Thermoplasmata archaeon]
MSKTTISDRIVLHLRGHCRQKDSYFLPPELTQKGIAKSIGSTRAGVTFEVRRLVEEGYVEEDLRKIEGSKQKVKAYFLTEKGEDLANEMREAILK